MVIPNSFLIFIKMKVIDLLNQTPLFELAYQRRKALDKIDGLSYQISTHLLKVFLFPTSPNVKHWLGELNGWLIQLNDLRLKPSNNKPTYKDFIQNLKNPYLENSNQVEEMILSTIRYNQEETPKYDIDSEDVIKMIEKICLDLSSGNFTPLDLNMFLNKP